MTTFFAENSSRKVKNANKCQHFSLGPRTRVVREGEGDNFHTSCGGNRFAGRRRDGEKKRRNSVKVAGKTMKKNLVLITHKTYRLQVVG